MAQDHEGQAVSKKPTQKETVLAMLEEAGPEGVTSNQFYGAMLPRFGARIHELKTQHGLNIVKEPVEDGHFRYILVGQSTVTSPQQPSPDLGRLGNTSPNLGEVDAQSPGEAEPPREVSPSSSLPPGQLFEVEPEEHQPVSHYEWEAA